MTIRSVAALWFLLVCSGTCREVNAAEDRGQLIGLRRSPCWLTAGHTIGGRPIRYTVIGQDGSTTMVLGGMHGDETSTVGVVMRLAVHLAESDTPRCGGRVVIVPCVNPDGFAARSRSNGRGVDLNRNFPTKDWDKGSKGGRFHKGSAPGSELETRAVMNLVDIYQPEKILTVHSPLRQVNFDGPARALAESMARQCGYPATGHIGYPTPGSFGTYAGKERWIPTITLELSNAPAEKVWLETKAALLAGLTFRAAGSLTAGSSEPFELVVAKARDSLYLCRRGARLKAYPVSVGFNGLPYDGSFRIVAKERIKGWYCTDRGWQYQGADKLAAELGPYFLALNSRHIKTKRGLGIHGTNQEELIGRKVSKGCVRMRNEDIAELYAIIPVGSSVTVADGKRVDGESLKPREEITR